MGLSGRLLNVMNPSSILSRGVRAGSAAIADPNMDVVCVATPDRLHVPQALNAIRASMGVCCKKPMGHWRQFNLSRQLFEGTRSSSAFVQIGNQGNSSPAWGKVARARASGRDGHTESSFSEPQRS